MTIRLSIAGLITVLTTTLLGQTSPAPLPPAGPTEDFSYLSGRWVPEATPADVDARFVGALQIVALPREITIMRGMFPLETFRVDGTITDFGDGRSGSMLLVADGIVIMTRRVRQLPAGPTATIYTDLYRVEGDLLTVDTRRSQSRPDGTLISMPNSRVTMRYRRVP